MSIAGLAAPSSPMVLGFHHHLLCFPEKHVKAGLDATDLHSETPGRKAGRRGSPDEAGRAVRPLAGQTPGGREGGMEVTEEGSQPAPSSSDASAR